MLTRVIFLFLGTVLVTMCFSTLKSSIKYYLKPSHNALEFRFLRIWRSSVPAVVALSFGLFFLIRAFLPDSTATYQANISIEISSALTHYARVAFVEELLFRIVPWLILFAIRYFRPSIWAERMNVFTAVGIGLAFGMIHVGRFANPDIWTYIGISSHWLSGMLYWYLLDKDGVLASIAAHFLFNMIVWGIVSI